MAEAKKRETYKTGLHAEAFSAAMLRLKGYAILHKRYKTKVGEIDLIIQKDRTVAFVEVKSRRTMEQALEATTPAMQARIVRAALTFLSHHPVYADYDLRFDLVAFSPPFYWRHLDNAWRPST